MIDNRETKKPHFLITTPKTYSKPNPKNDNES